MSNWPSVTDIASDVQSGKLKAEELVEKALKSIERNKGYQANISVLDKRAKDRAKDIDARRAKGQKLGKLSGVPFIAKDNFLSLSGKTTAASNILKPFEAVYQAKAIEKLEAEGAICVAKSNLDAFGHGASTENSDFFTTKHPKDKTRVPGGSSGGSAVAVALEMVPFAIGTDTGGSTRQPASLSGVVGFKPTYGLISRSGAIAMASSTDTVGTLATSVEDVEAVVDVMAGLDEMDGVTIAADEKGYTGTKAELKAKKFGLISECMGGGVEPEVKASIEQACDKLRAAGASVKEVSLPSLPLALAVYYIIVPAEISSNLARYDGQRYGHFSKTAKDLLESYELAREEGFGAEAKRRIMIGTYVLSSGYYDAYYKKAQTVRTKIINEFDRAFRDVDFLIGPTSPTTAFKIGENSQDPLKMYLADVMTVGPSLAGLPAISVPAGDAAGLPVGLQIIAPQRTDRQLLATARAFEGLSK